MPISESNNQGELVSFYGLLQKQEISNIIIPIIQRDYAQGREDNYVISEIRSKFVKSLRDTILYDERITLDCVYGFIDAENSFIPIDGQQRLTTMFLLHWYIAVSAGRLDKVNETLLKKFTYKVRDSAKEFCESLTSNSKAMSFTEKKPSEIIRNSRWYHCGVFDTDPTISGMLIMLDEIHRQFSPLDINNIYTKLFSSNPPILFWWLKVENFGLPDDLFIKMNARGKRLTRFEIFKSDLEDMLPESPFSEEWKEKIDNDWSEFFWNYYQSNAPKKAEHALFRFIMFISTSICSQQKNEKWEIPTDDIEQTDYSDAIDTLAIQENFEFLCSALNLLKAFTSDELLSEYQPDFSKLLSGTKMVYWEYARLYAVIDYVVKYNAKLKDYKNFERVLNNLLAAQREPNKRDMFFASQIDAKNYGSFTRGLADCILRSLKQGGNILDALAFSSESISGLQGFDDEVNKAKYIKSNPDNADAIYALEKSSEFKGLIHNIFFNGEPWISIEKLDKLLVHRQLLLRIVQSFSTGSLLLRVGYLWPVPFGETEEYSYRKHRYWFNKRDNGDFFLAAGLGETARWQEPLQSAIKALSELSLKSIPQELEFFLQKRINDLSYESYSDYFVKYSEFFTDEESSCCLLPESENLSEFKLLCSSRSWSDFYNPFCLALTNKLGILYEPVGVIRDSVKIHEGIVFTILKNGNWLVEISDESIRRDVSHILTGEDNNIFFVEKGKDCIEQAADFVKSHLNI